MGLTMAQGLILLLCASILEMAVANKDWQQGWWSHPPKYNNTSNRIVVGGSDNWRFGVNYTNWAINNGPFFYNDTLVFKYDPPSGNNTHPHSVFLLPNLWSYLKCDLRRARMVANESQGAGEGFEFVLKRWQPHYFACGASNGFHCNNGMKFFVLPLFRWRY